jgi:hypothetical protein
MSSTRIARWLLVPVALCLAACASGSDAVTEPDLIVAGAHASHAMTTNGVQMTAEQLAGTARLRALAARLKDPQAALASGRTTILACQEDGSGEQRGGMGIHYLDLTRATTADAFDPASPEAVMYEPQKNGTMKLVGMEFVRIDTDPKPSFHGIDFHHHPTLPFWVLHVWVPEHNPRGITEDWNPRVKCPAP